MVFWYVRNFIDKLDSGKFNTTHLTIVTRFVVGPFRYSARVLQLVNTGCLLSAISQDHRVTWSQVIANSNSIDNKFLLYFGCRIKRDSKRKLFLKLSNVIQYKPKHVFPKCHMSYYDFRNNYNLFNIFVTLMLVDNIRYFEREVVDIWKSKNENQ